MPCAFSRTRSARWARRWALRIEKVRSTEELKSAVLLAAQVIANTRGRQAAEAYVARFADI
jgi:hypothetical protein